MMGYLTVTFYSKSKVGRLRILIKAILTSFSHFNPIYIFSACLSLDLILLFGEFKLRKDNLHFAWLWLFNHLAANAALAIYFYCS
jgi:hypothetical protein